MFAQPVNCESEAFCQATCLPNKVWFFQKLEELGGVYVAVCGVMHVLLNVSQKVEKKIITI